MPRPIVDTHIHLWKLPRTAPPMSDDSNFPTGCCGEIPWLEVDALMADYNRTIGGQRVDKIVVVESSGSTPPEKIIHSNRWMLDAAAADPKILSVVGKLNPSQPVREFSRGLAALAADKRWVGLRIGSGVFLQEGEKSGERLQPNVLENLAALADRGLMLDTLGLDGHAVAAIARAVPGLTIVMNHFAQKPPSLNVEDGWRSAMQAVAGAPAVCIKVSDIHRLSSTEQGGQWPTQFTPLSEPARYVSVLDTLYDLFGPERLIFGSNWPVSNVAGLGVDSVNVQIDILESYLAGKERPTGTR